MTRERYIRIFGLRIATGPNHLSGSGFTYVATSSVRGGGLAFEVGDSRFRFLASVVKLLLVRWVPGAWRLFTGESVVLEDAEVGRPDPTL